ncbi:hypothetical protein E5673_13985 [Sphingomonas sp. PAMC26645]|uniref:hypothetical protein n=1 Tax=Sphingomonas sp. PAMC26645 TaxID=2565555 RepID=UPI00109D94D2|nr:hypothetical protein [Sphingomonas sp. PAMC26645]QCB43190.1 hypothetical protein E5673_13985 [Sphingomonas sp. PAMC26645]
MKMAMARVRVAAMASAAALMSVSALPVHSAGGQTAEAKWPVYVNARFGYHACYPAALLKPAAVSPNGDGRRFTGAGGAVLSVWGSNNALGDTVASNAAADRERLGNGGEVTYSVVRPTWYVLSGTRNGQIFYLKSVFARDAFSTMELLYPANAGSTWTPVTSRLSRCFGVN